MIVADVRPQKASAFGFDWNEAPQDLSVRWLPRAFDNGDIVYHTVDGHVVGVTFLSKAVRSDDGSAGKDLFEKAIRSVSVINGKQPFTEENDPGVGSAFYSCLTTKNQDSELSFSVCYWKAWWGESPFTVDGYFPNSSDSQVIVSVEPNRQVSVSIGDPLIKPYHDPIKVNVSRKLHVVP